MKGDFRMDAPTLVVVVAIVLIVPLGFVLRATVEPANGAVGPAALPVSTPTPVPVTELVSPWEVRSGSWSRQGELIMLDADLDATDPAIAVVFVGPDPVVGVDVEVAQRGVGVLVRFLDDENYWMVFADPDAEAWRVVKVIEGVSTGVEAFDGTVSENTRISVASAPGELTVGIGDTRYTVVDAELDDAGSVGLIALDPPLGDVRWNRFRAGSGVGLAGVVAADA